MRESRNDFRCRLLPLAGMLLALLFALTGCARSTEGPMYVAEFIDLDIAEPDEFNGEDIDFSLCGDELYYVTTCMEEVQSGKDSYGVRYQYDVYYRRLGEEEEARRLPIELGDECLDSFQILPDSEGNYFLAYRKSGWEEEEIFLAKFDGTGKRLFMCQVVQKKYENPGIRMNEMIAGLAQDKDGNLYVAAKNHIYLLDAEGESRGDVCLETETAMDSISAIACGVDGSVYCVMARDMYRIDFMDCHARPVGKVPPSIGMAPMSETKFLMAGRDKMTLYHLEEDTVTDLVEWQDCDLDTERLIGFTKQEDETAVVLFYEDSRVRAALIRETDGKGEPRQEVVTLGVVQRNESLRKAALKFNRQGGPYRVKVREYWDDTAGTEGTLQEGIASLNLDIVSGSCPDIVNLKYGSLESFAAKGVLENISVFLEKSSLKKEDFVDAVLGAYTVDGRLLALPSTFSIKTVAVQSDLVGAKTAWTLDEMMELVESHPDSMLLEYATKQKVLEFCLEMNLPCFMDWEKGSNSFDSEEFRGILEFSNRFPLEDTLELEASERIALYSSGKALLYPVEIASPDKVSYIYESFGWKDVTFIGYPTMDGSQGHRMDAAGGVYAIFSQSSHKEGAWSFLEALLDSEGEAVMVYAEGFPAKKDKLEALLAESMEDPYQTDPQSGKTVTDTQGNPVRRFTGGVSYLMPDGSIYGRNSYAPLPEEVDEVRTLISLARPAWPDEEVMAIIREEAAAYFNGQKTLDEVIGVIENRASLYMGEK
ncbi:hypothetical protein [uncultured Acetatifactor sp.]|uniref:hypothetical protein n=1 Tax=uncultured Acetatifactor sp. TaxID=1671927 RepID=UPI002601AAF5|nr:hypothetical protein [uncultured Acetatifactor sp.]